MKIAACCAVLIGASTAAVAGPCPMPTPRVEVLSPAGVKVDQQGGIVVGVVQEYADAKTPKDLAGVDWTFAGATTKRELAPGLALLQPKTEPKDGPLALVDGKRQPILAATYAHAAAHHAFAAPIVRKVTAQSSQGPRSSSQSVTAELAGSVPDAIAVLIYVDGDLKAGKPASGWARIDSAKPAATTLTLSASSRCSIPSGGGSAGGRTDKVVLVFVRGDGSLSAPSNEVEIK